ncbi:hypothetical protein AB0I60_13970 [Actinosynnema sp. NPDC050436]|uniref:hypothetical protein n=1 Tax=Actinosynnema sp. NPDC050436 TaxID=3155659 RepID=UPI00340698C9
MAWLPLVLVGLLGEIWEFGALAGIAVLPVAAWWLCDRRLLAAGVVFAVAAVHGTAPMPAVVAFAGALLVAAHDLHARRPGVWFPLLATGLGVFVWWQGYQWLGDEPWRAWAPADPGTFELSIAWASAEAFDPPPDLTWVPFAVVAVLCAGAAIAFARDREWVPLVVVGLLGGIGEYGPLAGVAVLAVVAGWRRSTRLIAATAAYTVAALVEPLPHATVVAVAAALVIAAHDAHARRPGTWFPLLATGIGLAVATVDLRRFEPDVLDRYRPPGQVVLTLVMPDPGTPTQALRGMATATPEAHAAVGVAIDAAATASAAHVLGTVVAAGLALWAWRARDLLVAATAAAYLAAAWYLPGYPEAVVLVGAAVAVARDRRTTTG